MPVRDRGLCAILLGLGVGWGAGNVGPVATSLAHSFGVPLAAVGLLSGTAYFAATAVATPLVVPLASRVGVVHAAAIAAAVMAAGHLLFAVSPAFGGLVAARTLVGAGAGLALVAAPVMARERGGVRLLGMLGGAITLGIAAALGLGSGLVDIGATWRAGFVISTAICALPLLVLPPSITMQPVPRPDRAFVLAALRAGKLWRLAALFVAANGVPLIVSAWLVAFLTQQANVRTAVAGSLAFVLFGLTTVVRPLGPRLVRGRRAFAVLAGGGLLVAAGGLVALGVSKSLALASLAVVLMGTGFALPYAVTIDMAERIFPGRAAATLAIVQSGPNVVPIVVIPLVGSALGSGHGTSAFLILAAFVAAVAIAGLHQPPERTPGSDAHAPDSQPRQAGRSVGRPRP
jgi:predicted MFS family arabinose efflux permease